LSAGLRGRPNGLLLAQVVAVVAVLVLAAGLAAVVLSRDGVRLAGTNSVRPDVFVVSLEPGQTACQTNVLVPKGSAGVRILVGSYGRPGPTLAATVADASGRVLRRGLASGYSDGSLAVLRFAPITQTTAGQTVCLRALGGKVALAGTADPNADNLSALRVGRRQLPADLSLQLVRSGRPSLLGMVATAFHRASLFKPGWVGAWTYYALVVFAIALVIAGAAVLVLLDRFRSPVFAAGAAVAVIAFGNAFVWSLVTPPFQPPDEVAHYAYAESIVERGDLPSTSPTGGGAGSYTLGTAIAVQRTAVGVVQNRYGRPPWTKLQERELDRTEDALGSHRDDGGGGYTTVASYSPVYYGLEAIPYLAARDTGLFTRLWVMRLLSALMVAAAALFSFLFAREMAPTVPWVGPAAGLAAAFEPMVGFMGGAVNNDALVILLASAELYLLARALRVILTPGLAVAIGAVLGLGIAVKPSMLALAPVAIGVLAWVLWRSGFTTPWMARLAGAALAGAAVVLGLRYAFFSRHEAIGAAVNPHEHVRSFSLGDFLSYVWQWYLPPLPFMHDRFAGTPPVYDVYFKGFWADFGHVDTTFGAWVYRLLAAACMAAVGLMAVALYRARATLTRIVPRVAFGLVVVAGFALLVNLRAYLALIQENAPFAQGRYLLPAIAVFGLAVAGTALAFGRRRGIVAATALVTALGAVNLFSLGLVVSRFYT
jgi:hypothetical protein